MPSNIIVWVVSDHATFEEVPEEDQEFALGYILGGGGVLVLGHRPEPVCEMREMLLACLLLGKASRQGGIVDERFLADKAVQA